MLYIFIWVSLAHLVSGIVYVSLGITLSRMNSDSSLKQECSGNSVCMFAVSQIHFWIVVIRSARVTRRLHRRNAPSRNHRSFLLLLCCCLLTVTGPFWSCCHSLGRSIPHCASLSQLASSSPYHCVAACTVPLKSGILIWLPVFTACKLINTNC